MNLNEFYEDTPKQEIQVIENQLIIAKQMQNKLIDLEKQKKDIEDTEKEMRKQLEEDMRNNGITKYESNDKRLLISLGESTPDEEQEVSEVDEERFIKENAKLHNEYVTTRAKYRIKKKVFVKGRKGTLRITVRSDEDESIS